MRGNSNSLCLYCLKWFLNKYVTIVDKTITDSTCSCSCVPSIDLYLIDCSTFSYRTRIIIIQNVIYVYYEQTFKARGKSDFFSNTWIYFRWYYSPSTIRSNLTFGHSEYLNCDLPCYAKSNHLQSPPPPVTPPPPSLTQSSRCPRW